MRRIALLIVIALLLHPSVTLAQEDVADVPQEDRHVAGDERQRYFLIGAAAGPQPPAEPPADGYRLLLVLPGGDGSADFNPFVRRIWKHALPDGYLVAQLVAVPSDDPNQIVWPTAKSPHPKQDFTTEQFIDAVIAEIKANHPIDEGHVYAMGWSSGGPAVYASILSDDTPLRGAFVAMSVFVPARLPPLANSNGKRFFLLQSPQDQVTRIHFARTAEAQLTAAGAAVTLAEYPGGHGWRGDVFAHIRSGVEWLQTAQN